MNCFVRSFSQYVGDPASLVSQTTLSEFRVFDELLRFGLWFFSLIVFFLQFIEKLGLSTVTFLGSANTFPLQKIVYFNCILDAFAKLRKETIKFVMSVRLSVRVKQIGSHWTDFMTFDIWGFFEDVSRKIRRNYNLTKIKSTLHEDRYTFFYHFRSFLLRLWNVEKIKTYISCSVTIFKNSTLYEKMWKNIVEQGRPQVTTWCARISCWIPKATNAHTQVAFPL